MHQILAVLLRTARNLLSWTGLGRVHVVRQVYDHLIMSARDPHKIALVQGHRMFLDPADNLHLTVLGVYERRITELVNRHVRPGDVAVDIGANIGYYTLIMARLVGPQGRVYAFEPAPDNFAILKRNVELNGYKNVTLVPKAVSDRAGVANLYLSDNSVDHRIYDSGDGRRIYEVETVRLDEFLVRRERKISFIKMDVQGSEGQVLRGLSGCFEVNSDLKLVTEFWPYGLQLCGTSPRDFLESLAGLGLQCWQVTVDKVQPTTIPELISLYDPSKDEFSTDLFCARQADLR